MSDPLVATGGVVCVVLILLVVLAARSARRRQRQRWEQLREWAGRNGWRITSRPAVEWWRRLPGKNAKGVTLLLSGTVRNRPVYLAEYEVTDLAPDGTGGTTPNTHHHTVVVVPLRRPLPEITVEPRRALSRLLGRDAGTGDQAFDKAFRIHTPAPQAIPSWCTPQLRAAHASGHVLVPWSVQGVELLHHTPGRLDVTQAGAYAQSVAWLADALDAGAR